jgi:PAS domain S-box-containing protein
LGDDRHAEDDAGRAADTAASLLTFENAPLPLGVFSPDGIVVMANRAMRDLLGYGFEGLVGRSVFDVVVGDRDEIVRAWADRIGEGTRVTPEQSMRVHCADGSELRIRASSVLVPDARGTTRYIVARVVPQHS